MILLEIIDGHYSEGTVKQFALSGEESFNLAASILSIWLPWLLK
jgi:hypothetical protein